MESHTWQGLIYRCRESIYQVDQTPGNEFGFTVGIVPRFTVGSDSYEWVPFPFETKNTNYTVTLPTYTITNIGSVTPTVYRKYNDGVLLKYQSVSNGLYGPANLIPPNGKIKFA